MDRLVLSLLVENNPGVLNRVAGLLVDEDITLKVFQ